MAQIIKRVQKYEGGKPLPILDTRIRTPFQQRIMQNGDEYKLYSDETNDFTNNPEENVEYVAPKAIIPEARANTNKHLSLNFLLSLNL